MDHVKVDLAAEAERELARARADARGHSAAAELRDGRLRHTLVAILDGHRLGEHAKPEAATFHVLRGRAVVQAGADGAETTVSEGEVMVLPSGTHDVRAEGDLVALLTTIAG